MNHYLVSVKITHGEFEESDNLIVLAKDREDAGRTAINECSRGELEPSDYGYFDMGCQIHLAVKGIELIQPEHLPILRHYLQGVPLPEPEGWHVSWEIDLDKSEAETARDAAVVASCYALAQFSQMAGIDALLSEPVTKPALTVNGQLIDFEQDH